MLDAVIVWVIVAAVLVLVARYIYRGFSGKKESCACCEASCPHTAKLEKDEPPC